MKEYSMVALSGPAVTAVFPRRKSRQTVGGGFCVILVTMVPTVLGELLVITKLGKVSVSRFSNRRFNASFYHSHFNFHIDSKFNKWMLH
jgi:hypothetical protein